MKAAWGPGLYDGAAWNSTQVEEIDLFDVEEMLVEDVESSAWEKELGVDSEWELIV